ncbi:MAG TPA: glycosyltransferase [Solirubrobacteraceae bacterium]|jgi:tetratricopeptide (TPR) repeat protein
MALRLTDAAPNPDHPSGPSAATLVPRAHASLAQRDIAAYRALFAEAAGIDDRHRRYEARKKLIEAALQTGGHELSGMGAVFAAAAREALDVLNEDPCEPLILNYTGVAFYELGELDAAEALFKAAGRLDPDLPHVERNLREIARRRRQGLGAINLPAPLKIVLKDLAPRARKIAAKAQPAEGLTLSLCMIVKDEEAMLGRTLEAIRDHVDEIVVVDTGSQDRTVEIAESFGAKVLHHQWTGDFSEARNISLEAATGDWIIYLDADEVLVDGDGPRLRALTAQTWREAFYLVMTNFVGDVQDNHTQNFNALRIFRNRPEYRFEGRLHEQWADKLPPYLPERLVTCDVRVQHFGYLGAVRDSKGKSERNLELLRRQAAEGDDSPFMHFNLGSEYHALDDLPAARAEFERAWEGLRGEDGVITRLAFVPSLANRYLRVVAALGDFPRVRELSEEILERFPGFTDIVFQQAISAHAAGDPVEAERLLRQCMEMGDAPSMYAGTVGTGTYLARLALADVYRLDGRLDEAEAEVRYCLEHHASFMGVVEPYAALRLAQGAEPAEVAADVHAAIPDLPPGGRFMLAVTLYESGAAEHAETELRAVLDAQPQNGPALLSLGEALLSQARFADAIAELDAVPADSTWAPAAARAMAFAALAGGDAATGREILARPAINRLAEAEASVLRAWCAVTAGEQAPASLPADAAPCAIVMLEALAKVEAFDAFEALAGCYDAIALPWRERRERLAAVYLRRGFLESAADEWITVCETEGIDAAALMGLAQVAWARGMDEDAAVLAAQAQEIEPENAGAARMLEHLATAA